MALTLEIEHLLKSKKFDELYNRRKVKWDEMAANAKSYTETCIAEDEKVRPGDIAENLQNAIKIDPDFEAYLSQKKLIQKYWVRHFSDYILDQLYPAAITRNGD